MFDLRLHVHVLWSLIRKSDALTLLLRLLLLSLLLGLLLLRLSLLLLRRWLLLCRWLLLTPHAHTKARLGDLLRQGRILDTTAENVEESSGISLMRESYELKSWLIHAIRISKLLLDGVGKLDNSRHHDLVELEVLLNILLHLIALLDHHGGIGGFVPVKMRRVVVEKLAIHVQESVRNLLLEGQHSSILGDQGFTLTLVAGPHEKLDARVLDIDVGVGPVEVRVAAIEVESTVGVSSQLELLHSTQHHFVLIRLARLLGG